MGGAYTGPSEALRTKLDALPTEPGVYIFIDAIGRVIYIGKAVNLRARVRSYFAAGASDGRVLFTAIVKQTVDLDRIVCSNELEALLLENNLIKKHRPRFNLRLRDDKTYVSLRVTVNEAWPRVQVIRHWKDDGNLYFGPYPSASSVREVLKVIKKYIPLRTCTNSFFESRRRPCLEYEIGRCTAPCVGHDTEDSYAELVEQAVLLLRGRDRTLIARLEERMARAAEAREYERAARIRDQIAAVRRVLEKQNVSEVPHGDCDVFALHRENDFVSIQVMLVRDGRLLESAHHSLRTREPDATVIAAFLGQFYLGEKYLPPEVLVPVIPDDRELLQRWLSDRAGRAVEVKVPQRGGKRRLIEMAEKNAAVSAESDELRLEARERIARSLAEHIGVSVPIRRIECYDISNIQGALSVASKVSFDDGEPDPDLYRRFRIRTVRGADDFASMREVLDRRFRPSEKRDPLPDLVLVDGGKGQLGRAVEALAKHGLSVPVAGIAKERRRGEGSVEERIFIPGRPEPLDLPQESAESLLLQRVRDEAHRFANTYHRELRRKTSLVSGLEEIPGVGPKRRKALMKAFGSLQRIREADLETLAAVPEMSRAAAESTWRFLHAEEEPELELPSEERPPEELAEGGESEVPGGPEEAPGDADRPA